MLDIRALVGMLYKQSLQVSTLFFPVLEALFPRGPSIGVYGCGEDCFGLPEALDKAGATAEGIREGLLGDGMF